MNDRSELPIRLGIGQGCLLPKLETGEQGLIEDLERQLEEADSR